MTSTRGSEKRATGSTGPIYRFHASRIARRRFAIRRELFGSTANLVFVDLTAVRTLARAMGVAAGDLNAMGLIDEILHLATRRFLELAAPGAFGRALAHLEAALGRSELDRTLERFVDEFPPPSVAGGSATPLSWLAGSTAGVANREIALEELLHLWLANANTAFDPFKTLFDDASIAGSTGYRTLLKELDGFLKTEPSFGPESEDLVTLLRSPAVAFPHSLAGQIGYLRRKLGSLMGDLLARILIGLDVLREEEKLGAWLGGPVRAPVPVYEYDRGEIEAFSLDRDWMPRAVMIAKNALVWLDQLSRFHGRPIRRLDEVPDSELDTLARRGFTALWLIGVWERSPASRTIKRRMGNPEAESSAYSVSHYQVAAGLGGAEAAATLRDRALRRGIRLASDMVPNHTSIDSRWVIEHPERFLAWPHPDPPYPSYSFTGPDLSSDGRVGIFIEDHYWTRSDAAIVFKRLDRWTGEARYIYHGNDGTGLPWNDTAQLDFLREDTRDALIGQILAVARLFPIIRFDAAMTLTKRHYQRLWFPEPGRGGDIPSRAGQGVSREELDRRMPREFWREVVDRVAAEAPDTLLLAEAFWLLEGYFVRTLGMHRVYNSAFMNMLKAEDNANYRLTIRNTLEFDPGVLERFVNFMSNPDEQTAIDQFGWGDKYFGVCTLMATLPGLPMFAHGQIEGFREKYGMEFGRAYWDERPDEGLVAWHEQQIFPLLRRRRLFARAARFLLYDLRAPEGWVNEDVFAYSNADSGERGLVLYNNSPRPAGGWIRESAARAEKTAEGKRLVRRALAEGLDLGSGDGLFVTFRDHVTGLHYIRSCSQIARHGLAIQLGPYERQVFLDFAVLADEAAGTWGRLCESLGGRGVEDLGHALRELELAPVRTAFASFLRGERIEAFFDAAHARTAGAFDLEASSARYAQLQEARDALDRLGVLATPVPIDPSWRLVLRPWAALVSAGAQEPPGAGWLRDWMLDTIVQNWLREAGASDELVLAAPDLLRALIAHARWMEEEPPGRSLLASQDTERLLEVNEFEGVRWLRRERFELLAGLVGAAGAVEALAGSPPPRGRAGTRRRSAVGPRAVNRGRAAGKREPLPRVVSHALAVARWMLKAAEHTGWRWDTFKAQWLSRQPSTRSRSDRARKT